MIQPRTLPGFMELLPEQQILFNQMKETIKKSYEKFGFLPIDTPVIEMSEVLLAKAASPKARPENVEIAFSDSVDPFLAGAFFDFFGADQRIRRKSFYVG